MRFHEMWLDADRTIIYMVYPKTAWSIDDFRMSILRIAKMQQSRSPQPIHVICDMQGHYHLPGNMLSISGFLENILQPNTTKIYMVDAPPFIPFLTRSMSPFFPKITGIMQFYGTVDDALQYIDANRINTGLSKTHNLLDSSYPT